MKTYIKPTIYSVSIDTKSVLLNNISIVSDRSISSTNAGLVKQDNTSSRGGNHSVWDDDWSQ